MTTLALGEQEPEARAEKLELLLAAGLGPVAREATTLAVKVEMLEAAVAPVQRAAMVELELVELVLVEPVLAEPVAMGDPAAKPAGFSENPAKMRVNVLRVNAWKDPMAARSALRSVRRAAPRTNGRVPPSLERKILEASASRASPDCASHAMPTMFVGSLGLWMQVDAWPTGWKGASVRCLANSVVPIVPKTIHAT